ncbi:MAG: glycosyltransferase [Saprospiraceae bacterium]|nr:glycosyltransferase [Saprospiraceae bacterium]
MQLSVVIVNYNVRHFLEQALGSVRRAMQGINGEVWVVDNNSVDDSVRMVQERFPEVRLIANQDNPGFSVANNQALRQCQGEFVLLLNPDTLVEEDTFHKCLQFMQEHPDAGALGVKLIDGSGKYLPESKRGFPSPWVAFCKTIGLSALFPQSAVFNHYHLGHLSESETHEIEVLAGCFMFIRRKALEQSGLLDEDFFMYGEDIDLSYRLTRSGYKNYYFPETSIIHYKGESTKKGSLNYVKTFYQAMIIFAQKHFSGRRAGMFILMLKAAIWLRAGITLAGNFWRRIRLPLFDALAIYLGLLILKDFWANYFYKDPHWFKSNVLWFNFPLYILIWLGTTWLNGAYDEPYNLRRLTRGLSLGTLILAAVYGFLDLDYRPSRALVLMGAVWAVLSTIAIRILLHLKEHGNISVGKSRPKNLVIVGSETECSRVEQLLHQTGIPKNLIGFVTPQELVSKHPHMLGNLRQLNEIARIYQVNEIIFCSKDVRSQEILSWMTQLGPSITYKIVPEESMSIIGSSSKDEPGELYTIDIRYNIAQTLERRNKRIFDLAACLVLILMSPVWLFFSKQNRTILRKWSAVFKGKYTWVGYVQNEAVDSLPTIKPGVFSPLNQIGLIQTDSATAARLNFFYARDWEIFSDLEILWKAIFA